MAEAANSTVTSQANYHRVLIPCKVEPGMFRDEWLVLIDAVDPKDPTKTLERPSNKGVWNCDCRVPDTVV
jgi:hypothetical protein